MEGQFSKSDHLFTWQTSSCLSFNPESSPSDSNLRLKGTLSQDITFLKQFVLRLYILILMACREFNRLFCCDSETAEINIKTEELALEISRVLKRCHVIELRRYREFKFSFLEQGKCSVRNLCCVALISNWHCKFVSCYCSLLISVALLNGCLGYFERLGVNKLGQSFGLNFSMLSNGEVNTWIASLWSIENHKIALNITSILNVNCYFSVSAIKNNYKLFKPLTSIFSSANFQIKWHKCAHFTICILKPT